MQEDDGSSLRRACLVFDLVHEAGQGYPAAHQPITAGESLEVETDGRNDFDTHR
jgi:hypothetical protein